MNKLLIKYEQISLCTLHNLAQIIRETNINYIIMTILDIIIKNVRIMNVNSGTNKLLIFCLK